MKSSSARMSSLVVGGLALLLGLLWMGQGLGYFPGSFMTGAMRWFWIGLVLAGVGLVLVLLGSRRPPRGGSG